MDRADIPIAPTARKIASTLGITHSGPELGIEIVDI